MMMMMMMMCTMKHNTGDVKSVDCDFDDDNNCSLTFKTSVVVFEI